MEFFKRGSIVLTLLLVALPAYAAPHLSLSPDTLPVWENAASVPFTVHLNSTEPLVDLATTSVSVENATVTSVATSSGGVVGENFDFFVSPLADGPVSLSILSGVVHSIDQNDNVTLLGNVASNALSTTFDGTAPTIDASTMPADMTLEATSSAGATAVFATPTATDTLSGVSTLHCTRASGMFAIGTTTVECDATDVAGNVASSTFTVVVRDTTAPTITPPAAQLFSATGSSTTPMLVFATATDAVDAAPVVTYSPLSFVPGLTTVTWTATDASGNSAATTSLVEVTEPLAQTQSVATTTQSDSSVTGVLGSALSVATTSGSTVIALDIPAGTTLTGTSTWDGTFSLPQTTLSYVTPSADSGKTVTVGVVIALGSDESLTLDHAARLTFVGQAGAQVGYSHGSTGTFVPITTLCSADSQAAGDALAAGGECYINSGSDLVVWTKHFTSFVSYTQSVVSVGGGGGGSSGGGGGGGGGIAIPATAPAQTATTSASTATTTSAGEVLGSAAYHFTLYLKLGSRGTEVSELQQMLVAAHVLAASNVSGYFGPLTQAAVMAYQEAHNLSQTGTVGPKTRALLNKGTSEGTVLGAATYQFTQYLKLGSHGNDVEELQNILVTSGYLPADDVTGYFGPITQAALMTYQTAHGVTATGTVGPLTRAVLNQESL